VPLVTTTSFEAQAQQQVSATGQECILTPFPSHDRFSRCLKSRYSMRTLQMIRGDRLNCNNPSIRGCHVRSQRRFLCAVMQKKSGKREDKRIRLLALQHAALFILAWESRAVQRLMWTRRAARFHATSFQSLREKLTGLAHCR
jgi:hypothetical protein